MQKFIGFIFLSIFVATPVCAEWTAENCTSRGGRFFTDPNTGKVFCASEAIMNWWSANAWCQRHGGRLADIHDLCPGVGLTSGNACPNLTARNDALWRQSGQDNWTRNTIIQNGQIKVVVVARSNHSGGTPYLAFKSPAGVTGPVICDE